MTLLIGLYYFYNKSYNNKSGLKKSMEAVGIDGLMPPKVTGTRWLGHLSRGISSLVRTYKAYEAHLSTLSHKNPKAEGLVKIMLNKDVLCFLLFLKDVLDPLMRLSLRLQKPETTFSENMVYAEATTQALKDCKPRNPDDLSSVLESGCYQEIKLKGSTPSMAYKETIIDGFIDAIEKRFNLNKDEVDVLSSTKILNLKDWPAADSPKVPDFGIHDVKVVSDHYHGTLRHSNPEYNVDDVLSEFRMLKKVLYSRHGEKLQGLSWAEAYDHDFPNVMLLVDLLNCIPPTSVSCETTFSQLKLIKTSRRTRLRSSTLNALLLVKLESPTVQNFDPTSSINKWLDSSIMPRRPSYKRRKTEKDTIPVHVESEGTTTTETAASETETIDSESESDMETTQHHDASTTITGTSEDVESDVSELDIIYFSKDGEDDEFCEDFVDEEENWQEVFLLARSM